MNPKIGFVGLGRMGTNMVLHLLEQGVDVVAYNRTWEATKELKSMLPKKPSKDLGEFTGVKDIKALVKALPAQKIIWLMIAAGKPVDDVVEELEKAGLKKDDIVIDGGNSHYRDSVRREKSLNKKGVHYIDCGTSGGLTGARGGACLMLGGEEFVIEELAWLWDSLAAPAGGCDDGDCEDCAQDYSKEKGENSDCCGGKGDCCSGGLASPNPSVDGGGGWLRVGSSGAGHYVKMVHNGVEYGMNQALGEGFEVLSKAPYTFNLSQIADLWNHGSIVRGYLVSLLVQAFGEDPKLSKLTGKVGGGESGEWAYQEARDRIVMTPVLKESLYARKDSHKHPGFVSKVVSALRRGYGGHTEAKASE